MAHFIKKIIITFIIDNLMIIIEPQIPISDYFSESPCPPTSRRWYKLSGDLFLNKAMVERVFALFQAGI